MFQTPSNSRRLIAVAVIAGAVLLALVIATGGSLSGPGGSGAAPPTIVPPAVAPTAIPLGAGGTIKGAVTVSAHHLKRHTWRFIYTVRDTGKLPIGGFQLNAPTSNLFHIANYRGWNFYGSGICRGSPNGLLIYWSTSATGTVIKPKHTAHLGFEVNTSGVGPGTYALSWGASAPQTGKTRVPIQSSLPTTGPCTK
jgi:hypothetical protein